MAEQDQRAGQVDEDSLIDQVIDGRYKITGRIGAGGVGVVYRAEHVKLARPVAVKVLRREYAAREPLRLRFDREARAMAALSHPGIVAISDYGVWRDLPFLVMDLLVGETLKERLAAGPLPGALVVDVGRQLLVAVAFAHDQGLLHRDLKPGNVFLGTAAGGGTHVTILDLGLAKFVAGDGGKEGTPRLTVTGMAFGTPAYMAPEQAAGAPTDRRTDLYSIGVIFFEMIAGRLPFVGDSGEMMRQHLFSTPPRLSEILSPLGRGASPELEAFFVKVLAKERSQRFQAAVEMLDAFERLSGDVAASLDADERDAATASTVFAGAAGVTDPTLPDPEHATVPSMPPAHDPSPAPAHRAAAPAATSAAGAPEGLRRRTLGIVLGVAALVAVCLGLGAAIALCSIDIPDEDAHLAAAGPAPPRVDGGAGEAGHAGGLAPGEPSPPQRLEPLPEPAGGATAELWGGALDPVLASAKARLDAGQSLDEPSSRAVMAYAMRHRGDPRPFLLLARWRYGRRNLTDAIGMYEEAYKANPAARTDPHMLEDLVALSRSRTLGRRAARTVRDIYGASAIPEVDRALADPALDDGDRRRLGELRAELALMPAQ
jgi:serine/threonine-protein kinase